MHNGQAVNGARDKSRHPPTGHVPAVVSPAASSLPGGLRPPPQVGPDGPGSRITRAEWGQRAVHAPDHGHKHALVWPGLACVCTRVRVPAAAACACLCLHVWGEGKTDLLGGSAKCWQASAGPRGLPAAWRCLASVHRSGVSRWGGKRTVQTRFGVCFMTRSSGCAGFRRVGGRVLMTSPLCPDFTRFIGTLLFKIYFL